MNSANPLLEPLMSLAKSNEDIEVVWLYGSRADATANEDSDYDLAIAFKTFINDPLKRRLRPEELAIEWAHTLQCDDTRLSIVDINLAPITLGWEIIRKGKRILCNNDVRAAIEENRISSMYELNVLYHRKHYEQ